MSIDTRWYLAINAFARSTPAVHAVMAAYALWAGPVLLVLIVAVVWWRARRGPDPAPVVACTVLIGVATMVALLLCQDVVAGLIARPRPCAVIPRVQVLLSCSADFSMPSDHAVIGGAIAGGLWFVSRRAAVAATLLALLLAFARVYTGVHYPADTLVGLVSAPASRSSSSSPPGARPRAPHAHWCRCAGGGSSPTATLPVLLSYRCRDPMSGASASSPGSRPKLTRPLAAPVRAGAPGPSAPGRVSPRPADEWRPGRSGRTGWRCAGPGRTGPGRARDRVVALLPGPRASRPGGDAQRNQALRCGPGRASSVDQAGDRRGADPGGARGDRGRAVAPH